MISLNKFLCLCSAECMNYAQVQQPKSSNLVHDFLRRQNRERLPKPWNRYGLGNEKSSHDDRKQLNTSSMERLSKHASGRIGDGKLNRLYAPTQKFVLAAEGNGEDEKDKLLLF